MSACLAVKPWSRLIDYLNHGAKGFRETRAGLLAVGISPLHLELGQGGFKSSMILRVNICNFSWIDYVDFMTGRMCLLLSEEEI